MVASPGALSNPESSHFARDWAHLPDDFSEALDEVISPEDCQALFETLAEWNRYLEDEVPGFSELGL